jgi:hypothetical protein
MPSGQVAATGRLPFVFAYLSRLLEVHDDPIDG